MEMLPELDPPAFDLGEQLPPNLAAEWVRFDVLHVVVDNHDNLGIVDCNHILDFDPRTIKENMQC